MSADLLMFWTVEGSLVFIMTIPLWISVWNRYGPISAIARLAVDMLDANVGWTTEGFSSLAHSTGLTVSRSGRVWLNGEECKLSGPSKSAVSRAHDRFEKRRQDAKLAEAAKRFQDAMGDYALKSLRSGESVTPALHFAG